MEHTNLEHYLRSLGFSKEDSLLISKALPNGSFNSHNQLTQLIGKALLDQIKKKRFTVKEFANYLSQNHSITNARKYLAEGAIERANAIPVLADTYEDKIR